MKKKLLSIITPTHNCKDKIEKTIKSVLSQDEQLFEYLIIDGGSTDGTIDVVKKYRLHVHTEAFGVLREIKYYKRIKDAKTGEYLETPLKFMDDAMDAMRYGITYYNKLYGFKMK